MLKGSKNCQKKNERLNILEREKRSPPKHTQNKIGCGGGVGGVGESEKETELRGRF